MATRATTQTAAATVPGVPAVSLKPVAVVPPDEIERRVAENDTARSTRRAAAARRIGELARGHAAIADQLAGIERQLGEVLADAVEVVSLEELSAFTGLPVAALSQWRTSHQPKRVKRRKPPHANTLPSARSDHAGTSAAPNAPARPDAGARGRDVAPVP